VPRQISDNPLRRSVPGEQVPASAGTVGFNYEISGSYGRTDVIDGSQDLAAQKFVNAVNVTLNSAGQIVCNTAVTVATNAAPGGILPIFSATCVPLNLLGEGLSDPAARNYVTSTNMTRSWLQQAVFQLASRVTRSPDIREIDDYVLVNPSVYFNVDSQYRLTFSVSNLLNRHGEDYYGYYIPNSYLNFDTSTLLLGRRFAVSARAKF
jgi:outer membrane receptor protein involved in Fe transport